jgi:hypothetical protein
MNSKDLLAGQFVECSLKYSFVMRMLEDLDFQEMKNEGKH